ncbi:unnamed protein product, partial [Meganyctiphanes norvegica]
MLFEIKRAFLENTDITNLDPNFPWVRCWLYDHIYYSFYDGSKVYDNQDTIGGQVARGPHHVEKNLFVELQEQAVGFLETKYPGKYKREDCQQIRYRTVPTYGIEADVLCMDQASGTQERVQLLQPIKTTQVLYHHHVEPTKNINIIMPLKGRPDNLRIFLKNLRHILQNNPITVGLTIVYFDDEDTAWNKKVINSYNRITINLDTEFLLIDKYVPFSRGRGLQEGVLRTSIKADVLFFCDVDILLTKEFLNRCQTTPIEGHQIYVPTSFSLYNPEFYSAIHKTPVPAPIDQMYIGDNNGYWRLWGHGMVCLYKSDFHTIGGFDISKSGWGGEDLAFLKRSIRADNYKVIRALDPGLFHRYHGKDCNDANGKSKFSCIKVKASNEASKISLGFWYFRQKYNQSLLADESYQENHHNRDDQQRLDDDLHSEGKAVAQPLYGESMFDYKGLAASLSVLVLIGIVVMDVTLLIKNHNNRKDS